MKVCATCNKELPLDDFQKSGKYCLKNCKECYSKKRNADSAEWYKKNREAVILQKREFYQKARQAVLDHYGNKCVCCGETIKMFLTIDHINNDGHLHRQGKDTSHHNIYEWLVKKDYPEDFQILCMNCNTGKHRNGGVCPHKTHNG